ncbi:MAG: ABC transporter ATP-binding protein [Candidatus Micrarchaeaceae archaeon]
MIELRNLVKKFGDVTAVGGVSARFGRGISIITGPNGAGKSTLLRCIDGLYKPTSGSVSVNGFDPYTNEGVRKSMSLLTDNYALYDNLTVLQNLMFFGRLYKLSRNETETSSRRMLKDLNAEQFINAKVYALSRGTKQKIALVRALLCNPEILLLDEPTAFLDPKASESVRMIMEDMAKEGRTVVFVTQKVDEIPRFNARLIFLRRGRIASHTTTYSFYVGMAKGSIAEIRLAKPIDRKVAASTPMFYSCNGNRPTLLKIKLRSYRDISRAVSYLSGKGAYVVGIDYAESIAEKFS